MPAAKQLPLRLVVPCTMLPQGDGAVLVRPGKPQELLTPREFGLRVGLSADSIYRYIGSGAIPERLVIYAGKRKIYIRGEALDHFLATWSQARGGGPAALQQKGC